MWVRVHRAVAIALVAPLVVWSVTGLLFQLKPGWGRAYDALDVARGRDETLDTAIGPLHRGASGQLVGRGPLTVDEARALALDAVARSPYRADYGDVLAAASDGEVVRVELEHAVVEVGRRDARIAQHGGDTARIDWLYRLHYLQWTGVAAIDRVLAIVGLVAIWVAAAAGIVLFVRRRTH
jgi:hypothetical protein